MALDGTLLRQIRHELEGVLIGARIDKIHQISREEMIFILRLPQPTADGARSVKLYLSAGADSPRRFHVSCVFSQKCRKRFTIFHFFANPHSFIAFLPILWYNVVS